MKLTPKSFFIPLFGRWIFSMLFFLNKISIQGEENLMKIIQSEKPIMVCVWHGRMIFPSWYLRLITTNLYAIAGRHTPKYKNSHSPMKDSSVLHISSADACRTSPYRLRRGCRRREVRWRALALRLDRRGSY